MSSGGLARDVHQCFGKRGKAASVLSLYGRMPAVGFYGPE
ncbi:hypothetical protein HMPREF9141_0181 [Prevotella multiformis DSM 16608]|uniref:Uncharacterized protein n=1 Tax=Prevotella multiformis DSM 16608 TaxID=888743 RepID=F0F3L5_9BACT|nr:hypothetical protein HMPREF9141_0181 [Prevotella multiformis DSM 16608]